MYPQFVSQWMRECVFKTLDTRGTWSAFLSNILCFDGDVCGIICYYALSQVCGHTNLKDIESGRERTMIVILICIPVFL